MIKGAVVNIRDNRGRLPFDYVQDVSSREFAMELRKLLQKNQSACHLITGTQPVQKVNKNKSTIVVFYILFLTAVATKILHIYSR